MGQPLSTQLPPPVYGVPVPNSDIPGVHGLIYRNPFGYGPDLMIDGVSTGYENFNRGVAINPEGNCLGYRPIVNGVAQNFVWYSYKQVAARRDAVASGLVHLNLIPAHSTDGMRKLGLFSKNRPEWVIFEQACYCVSAVVVPMYDTSDASSLTYIIAQTELTTLVCGGSKELSVVLAAAPQLPSLRCVISMDPISATDPSVEALRSRGLNVLSLDELEKIGEQNPQRHYPPSSGSVASFCFTSGTTGEPKGALISHANLVADCAAAKRVGVALRMSDVHLSYLPLPHMFERLIQFVLFNEGAAIGFFQGDTLKIVEDLIALRPTLFPSVPRLLTRVHDKLIAGAKEAGGVKSTLFQWALQAKINGLRQGHLTHSVWDPLVFKAVKSKVGLDRVRIILTGSAPIAPHVLDFLRAVFACPVMEGYGQTESTAASTLTFDDDYTCGHVGGPLPCNEITLADVPEMGYLSTDGVHAKGTEHELQCLGRGEVCFRGPNVFAGYYKMAEKTAETIDKDGWLHSGDIGLWLPNGALKLIDRKKNLFKLSQGEYVAPEKIENIFNQSNLIAQSFVYGDSLKNVLVAVIVPDAEELEKWCNQNNVKLPDHASRCKDKRVKAAITADIERLSTLAKLQGFEKVKAFHLEPELWVPGDDVLTPTFKLKRQPAREKYRLQIDGMYAALEAGDAVAKL
eukprot:c9140_g1_i1.p1 GENE.c9140_g1_i1~~c9140_g1_i1.p1  ORF type:complete len:685 (-),score=162.54 c9140_g1_i1:51-2105(-)